MARYWKKQEFSNIMATDGVFGWLAENEAGFILCRALYEQSEIITLAVRPSFRRRGIAASLLAKSMARARESGAKTMFLEVAVSNAAAIALYKAAGFQLLSRRSAYYSEPDGSFTDALVMSAELY